MGEKREHQPGRVKRARRTCEKTKTHREHTTLEVRPRTPETAESTQADRSHRAGEEDLNGKYQKEEKRGAPQRGKQKQRPTSTPHESRQKERQTQIKTELLNHKQHNSQGKVTAERTRGTRCQNDNGRTKTAT
ncbi:hypothetical protein WJX77_005096 [Trebouxia sp. C0004]